jgi:predicted SAM-dependent methyltransferase
MRLHIGGSERRAGWTVINPVAGPHVDIVGDHRNIGYFSPGSVEVIYASHVFEHIPYDRPFDELLMSVKRVLMPQGRLMISVPDLLTICRMYAEPRPVTERFQLMRIIYGGQLDSWDFHKGGYDEENLRYRLSVHGFSDIRRVAAFGLFNDTSTAQMFGTSISLNMECSNG